MRILIQSLLLAGCSIVPRHNDTPEVQLHIAEKYCDKVRIKEEHRGIVFQCINYLRNKS